MAPSAERRDTDPLQGEALRAAKLALRQRVLAERDAMTPESRAAASRAIVTRILARPDFGFARALLLTFPFRSEWDTRDLVEAALAAGKTVAVPRVDSEARMLALHTIADPGQDVRVGYRGIPEPATRCPRISCDAIDFVLVPGVAFDRAGRRLGYGGGYYDRLVPLLPRRAALVAGAFELQLVARVPAGSHDITVGTIVTESREWVVPR